MFSFMQLEVSYLSVHYEATDGATGLTDALNMFPFGEIS